ncbi:cytochrome P450(BM-1) [Deinococcus xinjiangensis]|uniref:Cytochrome P450(BM-1) n=1 Tax=Deinococcus xinjiangensis TaxID=457454 RepID=A0ABP9V961_9DEIO
MTAHESPSSTQPSAAVPGQGGCPFRNAANIYEFGPAKAALQHDAAWQAGFFAESVRKDGVIKQLPVLYGHGPSQREMRRDTARFFTPTAVDQWTPRIDELVQGLIESARRPAGVLVDELSLKLAGAVVGDVVGVNMTNPKTLARIILAADQRADSEPLLIRSQRNRAKELLSFARLFPAWLLDINPLYKASKAHLAAGGEVRHLVDQLVAKDYSVIEALTEILTYASAGVLTTREFIALSFWKIWEDQALRARFVTSSLKERETILRELLRLNPVVSMLYRRIDADAELDGCPVAKGELIRIDVEAANRDPKIWPTHRHEVDLSRELPSGVKPEGLAFGAGPHQCPGGPLAIREAAVLLHELFSHSGLEVLSGPVWQRNEGIKGYEVRQLRIRIS